MKFKELLEAISDNMAIKDISEINQGDVVFSIEDRDSIILDVILKIDDSEGFKQYFYNEITCDIDKFLATPAYNYYVNKNTYRVNEFETAIKEGNLYKIENFAMSGVDPNEFKENIKEFVGAVINSSGYFPMSHEGGYMLPDVSMIAARQIDISKIFNNVSRYIIAKRMDVGNIHSEDYLTNHGWSDNPDEAAIYSSFDADYILINHLRKQDNNSTAEYIKLELDNDNIIMREY